jgi:uncharacterized protein YndB with AHSA1/START domain
MNRPHNPIIVEQIFHAPVTKVWIAITKLEEMKNWFFQNIPAFEPVVGFHTSFPVQSGDRTFTHIWKILEVEVNTKIKYHWAYEEYEGEGFVTFELFEQGDNTLLKLTNEGLESFPQDIAEFERDSCVAGWEYFIKGMLKNYLEEK